MAKRKAKFLPVYVDSRTIQHVLAFGTQPHGCLSRLGFGDRALIIAYSHCITHGYDMAHGMDQQKNAVLSGYWPLFRYNPDLAAEGKNPLQLDSRPPSLPLEKYAYNETRYTMLAHSDPKAARQLLKLAQEDVKSRWRLYENWAAQTAVAAGKEEK